MAAALSQERMAAAVILSTARASATSEASAWASDTSAQTPTHRSAAAAAAAVVAVALVVGPSPSLLQSMEKWRRPLSREFRPPRSQAPKVPRQLSLAFNYLSSCASFPKRYEIGWVAMQTLFLREVLDHPSRNSLCWQRKDQASESSMSSRAVRTACPPRKDSSLKPLLRP